MAATGGAGTAERVVWLTFDDGPEPGATDRVLETLERFGIKATFFVIGQQVRRSPALLKETAAAGHRIGNHTETHPHLTELDDAAVEGEIVSTGEVVGDLLGLDRLFRPPFGDRNRRVNRIIRKCGYRSLLWNISTGDWNPVRQPSAWMKWGLRGVRRRAAPSVVLMHDNRPTTADHLPVFIEQLTEIEGLRFGAPSDL
jgi:peptidoglycan/xylan/chitin deacetylase (PgdA/CDA1 family)